MTEFVRPIQERIEDLLILDIEALCDFADNLQYHIPDSLSESKLHATHGSILKESANGLVVGEASCRREQIVLHARNGSHGNLRGEVAHLVLSQTEISLTLLKDDFQRPAFGINPVGFEEVHLAVGGDEPVPLSPLAALAEKQADIAAGKDHVHSDVPASQTTAVLASLFGVVEKSDELVGSVLLTFIYVLRLAHLDHTKIVASDVTGSDEQDDLCAGKPTVGQHVVKVNLTLDNATYHLNHQCNLALVVFLDTPGRVGVLVVFLGETGIKLLLLQTMIPLLASLPDKGKVEQHLAHTICDADEQTLEAEHHRVCHMGVYLADKLRLNTPLGIVRVVHHQADGFRAVARPFFLNLIPKLERNGGKYLAPVIRLIGKKPIEHVLLAVEQAA